MEASIILAFDVGGTQIKASAVIDGTIAESTVSHYPAHADGSADEIAAHFAGIAADLVMRTEREDLPLGGIGLAFPGPFDYENGISLIRGLGKYESLYGVNVGNLLMEAVGSNLALNSRLAPEFGVKFENDAVLFGLGEAAYGEAKGSKRTICLTIGTGIGSCYLENGGIIKQGDGIPNNGWLYTIPYEDGIADDYVSRRGILRLAEEMKMSDPDLDVHDFAALALQGDAEARQLFEAFGRRMAEILSDAIRAYAPDRIVIGGQISKSGRLFVPAFKERLGKEVVAEIRISRDTLASTFKGIYDFVRA